MNADELITAGWYFIDYFQPEFRAAVLFASLGLLGLWLLVALKMVDRVR